MKNNKARVGKVKLGKYVAVDLYQTYFSGVSVSAIIDIHQSVVGYRNKNFSECLAALRKLDKK